MGPTLSCGSCQDVVLCEDVAREGPNPSDGERRMFVHYIILSSSYSTGRRIALHFSFRDEVDAVQMKSVRVRIDSAFDGKPPAYSVM